jgi:hypothetical protein
MDKPPTSSLATCARRGTFTCLNGDLERGDDLRRLALFGLHVDPKKLMRHPLGSREMTIEHQTRAFSILIRIEVQHYPCNVAPVGTFLRVIQDAEIGVDVFLVIGCDYRAHRSNVGQFRSHARLGMGSLGEKLR